MPDLDPATRARLEKQRDSYIVGDVRWSDLVALLAAYDAAVAERDGEIHEILDSYPCASPTCPAEPCVQGRHIRELEAERDAMRAGLVAAGQSYAKERDERVAVVQHALDAAVAERDHWRGEYEDCLRVLQDHARRADAAEAERDDLVQRVYRLLTHDGTVHGCCWDALTTAVQSVVDRGAR